MLTSEEVREIELRVAADYACPDAPGFRDSLKTRRDVAALLEDRAEMQAEIERLRAVGDAFLRLVELYEEGQGVEYRPKWVRSALAALEEDHADE